MSQVAPGTSTLFVTQLLVSVTLVAPFGVLEWVNRRAHEEFPLLLFTFMWVHALGIVLLLTPALRRVRAEGRLRGLGFASWAGLLAGALLGYGYLAVVIDQFPCFLGVPNCD